MPESPLLRSISQIHISVSDIDRAVEFYRDTLEMEFLFQVPGRPMAFFQSGVVRLYIGIPENEEFRSKSVHYYNVDSIDETFEALKGKGVTFRDEPHAVNPGGDPEVWLAFFNDPDGNFLALMEERSL